MSQSISCYLHHAVLGSEVLDDSLFIMWVLDHLFKCAAVPIKVETLAYECIVVELVCAKERLRNAPGTLWPCQLLCVEGTTRPCLQPDTILRRESLLILGDRLRNVDKLWEFAKCRDIRLILICCVPSFVAVFFAQLIVDEHMLSVPVNECFTLEVLRVLKGVVILDTVPTRWDHSEKLE